MNNDLKFKITDTAKAILENHDIIKKLCKVSKICLILEDINGKHWSIEL